jgi:DNA repair exonuclease SbcCD nuclease subunit
VTKRLLITADWQASVDNLHRCQQIVDQIMEVLNPQTGFLHLGDIKDSPNPVDQRVTNFLIKAFTEIRKRAAFTLYVRGNHDSIHVQDGCPSCAPLIEALGFDVVADVRWEGYVTPVFGIWMVPYFRNPELQSKMFQEALDNQRHVSQGHDRPRSSILAFHNEVAGCEVTAYRKSDAGYTPNDIGAQYYDLCVGGHIHKPQMVKPNIHFVGSPFCVDWGEANQSKRFLLVEA